jgi:hypothetical protein
MPTLSNPRHEIFAVELAKGATADAAYRLAGYAENRHNASRLKTNETIRNRVSEILSGRLERHEISIDRVAQELATIAFCTPEKNPTPSDKRQALGDLGRYLNMFKEDNTRTLKVDIAQRIAEGLERRRRMARPALPAPEPKDGE